MSNYKKDRAIGHTVKHIFSNKSHFFEVNSESGNKYNVVIKVGCDCKYQSVQGTPNGDLCSHVLAVLMEISKNGCIRSNKTNAERMQTVSATGQSKDK